jgi:GT2 family glycosyltransferase
MPAVETSASYDAGGDDVELSIVLVNHNGAECLAAALVSLAHNTAATSVECLVVDSGSHDGSWEGVERIWERACALRFEENVGFCVGCNRGAEIARGRLLAFVNFDGDVEPGWDEPLRNALEDPTVSVAAGMLLDQEGEKIEAAGLEIAPNTAVYGRQEGLPRASAPSAAIEVGAASGALMMVRRREFLELGGFYEPLWMYGEEADYALRVPGRIVFDSRSVIRHRVGRASGPARSKIRLYWGCRNRLVNARRHLAGFPLARSILASAAFDLLTLGQLRSRAAATTLVSAWRDGLRLMRRERLARSPAERKRAASKLVSLREAVAQQRSLGRL